MAQAKPTNTGPGSPNYAAAAAAAEEYGDEEEEFEDEEEYEEGDWEEDDGIVERSPVAGGSEDGVEYAEEEEEEFEEEEEEEAGPSLDTYFFEYEPWKVDAIKDCTVTAMCASDRAVAVGTSTGEIFLLSADGTCELGIGKRLKGHETAIKDICVDEGCDFVGTVSEGGWVAIESTTSKDYYHQNFERPLQTLSLHPQYKSHDDKPFVCAGFEGKVILSNRGFLFGTRKTTVLDEKDGRIFATRWSPNGHTLAWASDHSLVLASTRAGKKGVFWREPRTTDALRADLFHCNMFWESETRLTVGWGCQVFVINVRESAFSTASAEVLYYFKTDPQLSLCCLQPYDASRFAAILTPNRDGWVPTVQVCVMERTLGNMLSEDQLGLKNNRAALASQFQFVQTKDDRGPEYAVYLLVFPSGDNVRIRRVNDDDRLELLLREQHHEAAYEFIVNPAHVITRRTREDVGRLYLEALAKQQDFNKLAKVLPEVVGTDERAPRKWEDWINRFLAADQGLAILPHVPRQSRDRPNRGPSVALPPEVYEVLLKYCLERSLESFKHYIAVFKGLYNAKPVCNVANLRLKSLRAQQRTDARHQASVAILGECVGLLLEEQKRFDEAFMILKDIRGSHEMFAFIQRHHLEKEAFDQLTFLYGKSPKHAMSLIVDAAADPTSDQGPLAPTRVLAKIRANPTFQWDYFCYIARLLDPQLAPARAASLPTLPSFSGKPVGSRPDVEEMERQTGRLKTIVSEHIMELAQRCIDYSPEDLRGFLSEFGDCGDQTELLKLCLEHGMYEEAAKLQARTGNKQDALTMLIRKLKSVPKAITFIKEHDDEDLFPTLVATALEVDQELEGRQSLKHFSHRTRDRDTWASIASRYDVDLGKLMTYNGVVGEASSVPNPVKVPINLLEALLAAAADSQNIDGVDPIYLIRQLPANSHIPNLAERLTRIAASKKSHSRLMETIISVLNGDIHAAHAAKIRNARRAVRVVSHRHPCVRCGGNLAATKSNVVTYRCGHMMHCRCAIEAMTDAGAVRLPAEQSSDPVALERLSNDFFRGGGVSLTPLSRFDGGFPYCTQCGAR